MLIDWDELFKRQPNRYVKKYEKGQLVEVVDCDTGYTWVKMNDHWMAK